MDAYVDSPWRERAQSWADAGCGGQRVREQADARMLKRGVRQTAAQEVPNGLTYGIDPDDVGTTASCRITR